ncbi:MAG: S9 family peptidase [Xanthomonadaceae bacterium]|nr:S9 family peptidase [Xanthomonadaceae bacterium]MCA0198028.1 S9 family peptidase [Pseudomonadota bacterium]HRF83107.1 S9 family peptidase [Pseudoxanthomonas sp.]
MRIRTLSFLAAALASPLPAMAADAPIPVQDFVKHPTYSNAKISPNGEYLAMTVDRGDQDVLTVMRTSDLSVVKVNQLPEGRSVGTFYWTSPDRLMFNAVRKIGSFEQPMGTGEWFAVNADGSQPRPLVFYGTRDATQRSKQVDNNERLSLLDTLRDDDTNVAMTLSDLARSKEGAGTEVVLMDTYTGRRVPMARAPKENCSISLDADKKPRFALCSSSRNDEGEYEERSELYRRDDKGAWTLVSASKADGKHLSVVHTAPDGKVYATQSDGKAPAAIGTLDTATGKFIALHQDPEADISDLIWSVDQQSLIAAVTEAGAPKVTLIDEDHPDAEIYTSLASAFPGQFVDFSSATKDGKKIVVSVSSDTNPGELYLYDRDTGKARFLMQGRAWLDPKKMSEVKPFVVKSRDGKQIHGYLTLPHGSSGRNLPLIVNPHGGPIGPRDNWGFDTTAQMFASRGYAVLQVNFRGSDGYGKEFRDAGHMQWAQGIQNDILDATHWAIDQGYVDKDRICIFGGSFGGYSSLMAPIREPGLFQCAVGYVGVYDLEMLHTKGDIPQRESGRRYLRRTIGTDKDTLRAGSPTALADKVGIPVLLVAGARDQRAVPEQTEAMRDALVKAGNPPVETIIQSGEMHGFYKEENNQALYTKILDFFGKHIGGQVAVGTPSKAD